MTDSEEAFLQFFFGAGNALSLAGLPPQKAAELEPWIDNYRAAADVRPLPRITGGRQQRKTSWYVLIDDPRVAAVARGEMQGFVGRSYSDFDALQDLFDPLDPLDQKVLRTHPASFRFTVRTQKRSDVEEVRRLLTIWLNLRTKRPIRNLAQGSSVADHLYSFEEALRMERWSRADESLRRLEQSVLLREENIHGLEILLDDAKGRSEAVWGHRGFDRLVAKGPPRRVQFAMLRSAYRHLLAPNESSRDVNTALQTFRDVVLPRSRPLLAASVGVRSHEAAILLFLGHLHADSPNADVISASSARARDLGASPDWLAELRAASGVAVTAPVDAAGDLVAAMRAFNRNQLDLAWRLASAARPSWDRTALLLRIAREADSIAWAAEAVAEFHLASESQASSAEYAFARNLLLALERRFQDAGTSTTEPIPSGWLEWASRLGRPSAWSAAVRLAEAGMLEWPMSSLVDGELLLFAEALGAVHNDNAHILRRAIPYVLRALDDVPSNEPDLGAVLDTLLRVTIFDDSPGETFFPSLTDLLERRFRCGISDTQYRTVLRDVRDVIGLHGSQESLDALADLFDVLERYRCPYAEERAELGAGIVAVAVKCMHKMDHTQLVLIRELARLLQIEIDGLADRIEAFQLESREKGRFDVFVGSSLALYSLDSAALQRAKKILEFTFPGLKVQLTDAKVSTDALVTAARRADLFVVAHRSAKHAATDAIRAARSGDLVYAEGKGSSSIVRAVMEWAERPTPA